jgi:hypothetical protein
MDFTADVSLLKTTIPVQVSGHFNSISYGLDGKRPLRLPARSPGALADGAGQKAGDAAGGANDALKGVLGQ